MLLPRRFFVAAAVVLTLGGCTLSVDPTGSDATLRVQWSINGHAADAFWCEQAGIAQVRMNVNSGIVSPALTWSCAAGGYDSGTTNVLRAGEYSVYFEGVDSQGRVVASTLGTTGGAQRMVVTQGGNVDLGVQPFEMAFPGGLRVTFQFETAAGMMDSVACATAGVMDYTADLTGPSAEPIATSMAACPTALIEWMTLPVGATGVSYQVDVVGRDAAGATTWMGVCGPYTLTTSALLAQTCTVPHL